jgi:hypothetical protein
MSKSDIPCQALVRTIVKKPGLKETNFQVGSLFAFALLLTSMLLKGPQTQS